MRVDAGAGQVFLLLGKDGPDAHGEWTLAYAKMGEYLVTVDLLDGEGYWLATLAQNPLEIVSLVEEPARSASLSGASGRHSRAAGRGAHCARDQPTLAALPLRQANMGWCSDLQYAGRRRHLGTLLLGTYLAIRAETVVGGAVGTSPPMATGLQGARWPRCNLPRCAASSFRAAHPPPPPPPPPGASGMASSRPRCSMYVPVPACHLTIHRSPSCPVARP